MQGPITNVQTHAKFKEKDCSKNNNPRRAW
jgi:hypothetical protein